MDRSCRRFQERGRVAPHPEHDSFLAVSWLDDISTERLDSELLDKAEKDAISFHERLVMQIEGRTEKAGGKTGKTVRVGDGRKAGFPTNNPAPHPPKKG